MNELVYLKNDEAVCDSLQVAEKFGKRHDKLIAEIRRMYGALIGKEASKMVERNFSLNQHTRTVENDILCF